jgi:tetratricopeptide (TPR) repeat protein
MPSARKPPARPPRPEPLTEPTITFVVPGRRLDQAATRGGGSPLPPAMGLPGRVSAAVQLGLRRGPQDDQRLQARPGRDLVVLHLAGGPSLVLHPLNARDLMLAMAAPVAPAAPTAPGAASRHAPPLEVAVPAQLRWQGLEQAARGARGNGGARGFMGEVLLSAIEVVAGPVQAQAQDLAAERIAGLLDDRVTEAVYALSRDALLPLKGRPTVRRMTMAMAREGAKSGPVAVGTALVFVHGTFGDTVSSFAKLWQQHPQRVHALFERYGDRVYALDHATLGVSPIANALTLARACPLGARLHLVTYSRGGLVAEVLARAAALPSLDDAAKALFKVDALSDDAAARLDRAGRARAQRALDAELAQLKELIALLHERQVRIERIVRVAAPARGTLLASQRLDAYLSVFKWGLDMAQVPVAPEFVGFMAGVAQRRTDPARLPGLAAMVPDSPLIRWLHAADEPVTGELRVIAGDMEGDSVTAWLKTLLADGFYWTDNDLVVQTRSMYGGAPRAGGASFVLDQGGRVNHFNYFANDRTADALVSGLTQSQPIGWRPIGPLSWSGQSASGLRGATEPAARAAAQSDPAGQPERPAVFVLPGILGSHLKVDGKRVWLGFRLLGGFAQLRYQPGDIPRVEPDGAVGMIYDDLIAYLGRSHQVVEFAFDWRMPLEQEARRLGKAVAQALDARKASGTPVRIVAHSMGGLVARTMQLECKAVWDRMMAHPAARLLMLGTPNAGSWAPMQCLSGDDTFGNTLVAFGAPFQDHKARDLMAQFPGFMQLQAGLLDRERKLDQHETWQALADADLASVNQHNLWHADGRQLAVYRWGVPPQPVLDQAVALRRRLDAQAEQLLPEVAGKLALVVGHARLTPDGFDASGPEGLVYLNAAELGDGRVTLQSALLPGVRTWRIDCEHGSLPAAKDAFEAYLELLNQGSTERLPPVGSRAAATRGGTTVDPADAPGATAPAGRVRNRPARERSVPRPPEGVDRAALMALSILEPGTPPADGRALRVTVRNGDLSFVRQPIMVGHYASNTIAGTERAINTLIGGTMAESIRMGQYPDLPGTHQLFINNATYRHNPLQMPRPDSVLVVGLGEEGKLKGDELVKSVRLGVLALAQRLVERDGGPPLQFELGATLLGSGGAGITPAKSAQLVAQGVREANEAIRHLNNQPGMTPGRRWPGVAHLVLIELYLDRASDAWRALAAQVQATPGFYSLTPTVVAGPGALRRPLDGGYRGSDYDYIRALGSERGAEVGTIEYTLDTKRARVEVTAQSTQAKLVRELVARAATDQPRDRQIGRTLFQLLVPLEIEPFLGGTTDMLLELDRATAGIPWEMLDTGGVLRGGGGDTRPWAIRARLLRRLRLADYRARPIDARADAQVLVIGEPRTPDTYQRLPGARDEARAVRDLLAAPQALGGERVVALIAEDDDSQHTGPEAREVINALMSRDWRIVHLAGHGDLPDADNPKGVVMSNDTYLGPREIHNMRVVPELVFVNCCHLGARHIDQLLSPTAQRDADRPGFASGVAEELMKIGVRCVVAAGWAVEDEAAKAFATTLYAALLRDVRFMDAVAQAREAAHALGGNTWAAYQCYGDPDWTLRRTGGDAQRPARSVAEEFAGVSSPLGLTLALETLAVRSQYQGADGQTQRSRIRLLESRFESAWGGMGAVAEAFAVAWNAAGDREQAVRWYERALKGEDGSASLKASEQLGNLRVRLAWERVLAAEGAARKQAIDDALETLGQALAVLASLAGMQKSQERLMLVASALKRRAMVERLQGQPQAARQSIEAVIHYCQQAVQAGRDGGTRNLFYPLMGLLAAQCALAAADGQQPVLDPQALADSRQALLDRTRDDPDFWSVAGLAEIELLQALAEGTLADHLESLLTAHADLHARITSVNSWSSVLDQHLFVLHDVRRQGRTADRQAAERLIDRLRGYARPPEAPTDAAAPDPNAPRPRPARCR